MGGKLGPSPKVYCISLGGFVGRVPVPGRCLRFRVVWKVFPATVCMSMRAPHKRKKKLCAPPPFFFLFYRKTDEGAAAQISGFRTLHFLSVRFGKN